MRSGGLALVLALFGCGAEPDAPSPPALVRPAFELRPVVAGELARLRALAGPVVVPEAPEPDSDLAQEVRGLVVFLTSTTGGLADAAFEDIERLGDPALPVLRGLLDGPDTGSDERRSAVRLIGGIPSPAAAKVLAELMAAHPDPALRAVAAWKLEQHPSDLGVGELLRRLRYEKEATVVPWISRALAAHGNYAGVAPLRVLVEWYGTGNEAAGYLVGLAEQAGFEASLAGASELEATWQAGDPEDRLLDPTPSDHLRIDLLERVAGLAEFQLRGVDDGRFVLSSLGSWAAPLLADCLHDEDPYVRLHVAQALERMGPRGAAALPDLVAALAEPGLAPTAAAALGALGDPSAEPTLLAAAGPAEAPELRVAAARALGALGLASSIEPLTALDAAAPFPELDQALVEALVRLQLERDLDAATALAPRLVAFARDRFLDATTSMRVLREWIGAAAQAEVDGAADLLEAWDALAPDPYVAPTPAEATERRAARLALVEAALG